MPLRSVILFSVIISTISLLSCGEQPECDQETPYDKMNISFYNLEEEKDEEVSFEVIFASGSDSILYNNENEESIFTLPLNPTQDMVQYYFITGVRTDSIAFVYTRQLEWLSEKCGPNFKYDQLTILWHSFDSVRMVQPIIDNSVNKNVTIYN